MPSGASKGLLEEEMEARVTRVGVLASAHVGQDKNQSIFKIRAAALDLSRRSWPRLHEQPSLGWTVPALPQQVGFQSGFWAAVQVCDF